MKLSFLACALTTVFASSADSFMSSDDELEDIVSSILGDDDDENEDSDSDITSTESTVVFPVEILPGIYINGRTERGRVVEAYNETLIAEKINSDVASKIARQVVEDHHYDLFTPDTGMPKANGPSEWTELTPLGEITLGKRLYRGTESVIYEIKGREEYLIKYQANCDEIQDAISLNDPIMHPLLTDYWYSLEAFPMSPKVLFVSPPAFLCRGRFGKCDFSLADEEFAQCFRGWGTVRFMIMKKEPGIDVQNMRYKFLDGVVPFSNVMSIGSNMMKILEDLHLKARIVHGDIHAGNVLVVTEKPGTHMLKLIDFGRAFRLTKKSNQQRFPANRFHHFLYSHWQAQGFEWGARDDLVKTLQVLAQLMNPWSYMDYEKELQKKGPATLNMFKRSSFIFVQPEFPKYQRPFDPIDRLPIENEAKVFVRQQLGKMLEHVRGLSDINAIPNYKWLIDRFEICRRLANKEIVMAQLTALHNRPSSINDNTTSTTSTTSLPV